jgi:hypothetical protein
MALATPVAFWHVAQAGFPLWNKIISITIASFFAGE